MTKIQQSLLCHHSLLVLISTCCAAAAAAGAFNICTAWGHWNDGKLLTNHLCLLLGVLLLSIPNKVLSILPLLLLGKICLSSHTWRSFLCPGGWESNKDARDRFMRLQLQLTPGTSAPVLRNKIIRTKVYSGKLTVNKIQRARGVGSRSD